MKTIVNLSGASIHYGYFDLLSFEKQIKSIDNTYYDVYKIISDNKTDILIPGLKEKISFEYTTADFHEETVFYEEDNLIGFLNIRTKLFLKPEFYDVNTFIVEDNVYYCLASEFYIFKIIDSYGNILIDKIECHRIINKRNSVLLYINQNGKNAIFNLFKKEILYTDIQDVTVLKSDDLILSVQKHNKLKIVNIFQNIETDYIYDVIDKKNIDRRTFLRYKTFYFDRLIVSKDSKFGFINNKLEEVIKCKFDLVKPFELDEVNFPTTEVLYKKDSFFIDLNGQRK